MAQFYNPQLAEVGERIHDVRKSKRWSQDDLGERMDMDRTTISKYENGHIDMSVTTFFKFSEKLETSPNNISPKDLSAAQGIKAELRDIEEGLEDEDIEELLSLARILKRKNERLRQAERRD